MSADPSAFNGAWREGHPQAMLVWTSAGFPRGAAWISCPVMCGRFANPYTLRTLEQEFSARAGATMADWSDLDGPTENAAPTMRLPTLLHGGGGRVLERFTWGWSEPWLRGRPLINARGEEAADKAIFQSALRLRRCLLPAAAFYEWRESDGQPFAFRRVDGRPFAIAGLWREEDGVARFLLLTVPADPIVAPVHHRMALLPSADEWDAWLDPATPRERVLGLIRTVGGVVAQPMPRRFDRPMDGAGGAVQQTIF